jgi:hypothetical protein
MDVKTAFQVPAVACQLAVRAYLVTVSVTAGFTHLAAVSVDAKRNRAGPVVSLPPHATAKASMKNRAPIDLFVMFKSLERKKSRGDRYWSFQWFST